MYIYGERETDKQTDREKGERKRDILMPDIDSRVLPFLNKRLSIPNGKKTWLPQKKTVN